MSSRGSRAPRPSAGVVGAPDAVRGERAPRVGHRGARRAPRSLERRVSRDDRAHVRRARAGRCRAGAARRRARRDHGGRAARAPRARRARAAGRPAITKLVCEALVGGGRTVPVAHARLPAPLAAARDRRGRDARRRRRPGGAPRPRSSRSARARPAHAPPRGSRGAGGATARYLEACGDLPFATVIGALAEHDRELEVLLETYGGEWTEGFPDAAYQFRGGLPWHATARDLVAFAAPHRHRFPARRRSGSALALVQPGAEHAAGARDRALVAAPPRPRDRGRARAGGTRRDRAGSAAALARSARRRHRGGGAHPRRSARSCAVGKSRSGQRPASRSSRPPLLRRLRARAAGTARARDRRSSTISATIIEHSARCLGAVVSAVHERVVPARDRRSRRAREADLRRARRAARRVGPGVAHDACVVHGQARRARHHAAPRRCGEPVGDAARPPRRRTASCSAATSTRCPAAAGSTAASACSPASRCCGFPSRAARRRRSRCTSSISWADEEGAPRFAGPPAPSRLGGDGGRASIAEAELRPPRRSRRREAAGPRSPSNVARLSIASMERGARVLADGLDATVAAPRAAHRAGAGGCREMKRPVGRGARDDGRRKRYNLAVPGAGGALGRGANPPARGRVPSPPRSSALASSPDLRSSTRGRRRRRAWSRRAALVRRSS